ncbi:hypothetical protein ACYOEI_26295, partial [Singulisphaera rosea]
RALPRLLDDLFDTRKSDESAFPVERASALPFPGPAPSGAAPESIEDPNGVLVFYLTVLLAIAILLASVIPTAAKETKAA